MWLTMATTVFKNSRATVLSSQSYADMLLEEAEKLYNKLAKESVDEIISDYAHSTSSSS
jgi:hypothetical protein